MTGSIFHASTQFESWILMTVIANIGLTFVVQIVMYRQRMAAMRATKAKLKEIAHRHQLEEKLVEASGASNNFLNQFELPVLFYTMVAFLTINHWVTAFDFYLACGFVIMRAIHAYIHCTSNRVKYRFYSYIAGTILLWSLFIHFCIQWVQHAQ